jgi:hypothetical protein
MAKDAFGFYTKGIAIRSVLRNAGRPNFSSYRELGIQGAKLERMATAFDKRFPPTLKAATAKLRKERGYHLHRLTQQSKHVDVVMSKLFGEWLYTRYEISSSERKLVPKVLRAAVGKRISRFIRRPGA